MCDSCPECPECGQDVAQPATPQYLAGLLAPPALLLLATLSLLQQKVVPYPYLYALLGAVLQGTWMLVKTDDHISAGIDWTVLREVSLW